MLTARGDRGSESIWDVNKECNTFHPLGLGQLSREELAENRARGDIELTGFVISF